MMGKKNVLFKLVIGIFAGVILVGSPSLTRALAKGQGGQDAETVDTLKQANVLLHQGDLITLKVYSLTRVAITAPGIVDIVKADVNKLLLVGRQTGETDIFIWDEHGKRKVSVRVIDVDLNQIMARINKLLQEAQIDGIKLARNDLEGKVVATGYVTKDDQKAAKKIFKEFSPNVIDMVKRQGDLIHIDVQITELNTTLTKALGFDWTVSGAANFTPQFQETLPTFSGNFGDLFKVGNFARTTAILATVNALVQEGKGRILSKPSIVVTNGEQASFLVGGEIPIQTTTTSTGGASVQENVTFKDYGIQMTVQPEIKDGKIDLTLSISVRDVDSANAVGDNVAYTTRTAQTVVFLENGQTIVLAGLIKHNDSSQVKRIPFLSEIPVLGLLFRSSSTPTAGQDQELVISLTPRVIEQPKGDLKNKKMVSGVYSYMSPQMRRFDEQVLGGRPNMSMAIKPKQPSLPPAAAEESPSAISVEPSAKGPTPPANVKEFDLGKNAWAGEAPVAPKGMTKADVSKLVSEYVKGIQSKIAGSISYPYEAMEKGWEGTTVLSLHILSDGTLLNVSVKKSSGHAIFDKDAVNTAKILAPFAPFPAELGLEELVVTVPIVYSKNIITKQGAPGGSAKAPAQKTPAAVTKSKPAAQPPAKASAVQPEKAKAAASGAASMVVQSPPQMLDSMVEQAAKDNHIASNDKERSALRIYLEALQEKINHAVFYPPEAKKKGLKGTVTLTLTILHDGNLKAAAVKGSSGHGLLDKDALSTIHILAPFPPFPSDLKQGTLVVTIPIVYQPKAL